MAAQRRGHDVVAEEAREVGPGRAAADGLGEQQDAAEDQERQRRRPGPDPARADQHVEDAEQRRGLRVVALLEVGFEVEADRRQADEAEHQGRAQAAFEAVERVGLERPDELRQAAVGEGGDRRRAARQHLDGREVGLLDHLGEDLGEEAGVGERDGEEAGRRPEPEDLDQEERPEQLVHGAQDHGEHPHRREGRISDGEQKAARRAEADAEHREGHRPDHAPGLDREEVGPEHAAHEPRHLGPGIERGDREVGGDKARERGEQEEEARIAVGDPLHASAPVIGHEVGGGERGRRARRAPCGRAPARRCGRRG